MYRVVVADDQAIVRFGEEQLVNRLANFEVVGSVANGTAAYQVIEKNPVDVLITGLRMPQGESAVCMIRRIHTTFPDVRIVLYTGCTDHELLVQALQNGACGCVLKTSPTSELVHAVQTVVRDQQRYFDPTLMLTQTELATITQDPGVLCKRYESLTRREAEVLPLIVLGYSNKEIAAKLYISTKTVETHKSNINRKLGLYRHVDLVRFALQHHLVDF